LAWLWPSTPKEWLPKSQRGSFLAYFNRGLNAIIYGLLNQNFRREYKRILLTSGTRGAVCRVVPRAATPRVYRARFRLGFMIGTWSRQMRSSLD
jgi:hypothetical protein